MQLSRRQFLGRMGVLCGAVSTGPWLWVPPAASATPPLAPRIGWGSDPRTTLTVAWATDGPVANPTVDVGLDDTFGRTVAAETRTVPGWPVNYHRVTVDGLEAGRAYRYRIRHDGTATAPRTTRTAPTGPDRFTFAAYGDQGTTAGAEQVAGVLAAASPTFTFCLGDLCYADGSGGVLPAGS